MKKKNQPSTWEAETELCEFKIKFNLVYKFQKEKKEKAHYIA